VTRKKDPFADEWDDMWADVNMLLYEPHQDDYTIVDVEKNSVGRPMSEPSDITDITSTGRKRAAMMYPIFKNMTCEWAGLKFAGGGVEPIVGCAGNIIQPTKGPDKGDRHHGPDKNVINNSPQNVHRICSKCHNRWHAKNNKYYGERPAPDEAYVPLPEYDWQAHDPETKATEEEIEQSESWWAGNRELLVDVSTE
tara:strand:+ start:43 stop:630 length:588 start_codon:yes stop_codon:yes gene_type:complete